MSAVAAAAVLPIAADRPRHRRAPWPVVAAFYLWWLLIAAQSIGLAYIGFTFAQAARIGGPAWDILFVDVPIGVPTLVLVVLEIVLVLRLRHGSRAARVGLLVLAIPAAASIVFVLEPVVRAALIASASVSFTLAPLGNANQVAVIVIAVIAAALAIVAAVLPFIRPVGRYFWKPPTPAVATAREDMP